MLAIQIALLAVIVIIIWAAYDYWVVFSEDPSHNWFIGLTGAAFLFAVKVLYDRFTLEVVNERQYPDSLKDAMRAP